MIEKHIYLVATVIDVIGIEKEKNLEGVAITDCLHAYSEESATEHAIDLCLREDSDITEETVNCITFVVNEQMLHDKLSMLGENDTDGKVKLISVFAVVFRTEDTGEKGYYMFINAYYETSKDKAVSKADNEIQRLYRPEKGWEGWITFPEIHGKMLLQSFFDEADYIPKDAYVVDETPILQ